MSLTFALQALLARHEAYVQESQQEREELSSQIEALSEEYSRLQDSNLKLEHENSSLQSQVQAERRDSLTKLQDRTDLQDQITFLEGECARLQQVLFSLQSESKSTQQRCRRAEHGVKVLQDQIEFMEVSMEDERKTHSEALHQFQQRSIESATTKNRPVTIHGVADLDLAKQHTPESQVIQNLLTERNDLQKEVQSLRDKLTQCKSDIRNLEDRLSAYTKSASSLTSSTSVPARNHTSLNHELQYAQPSEPPRTPRSQSRDRTIICREQRHWSGMDVDDDGDDDMSSLFRGSFSCATSNSSVYSPSSIFDSSEHDLTANSPPPSRHFMGKPDFDLDEHYFQKLAVQAQLQQLRTRSAGAHPTTPIDTQPSSEGSGAVVTAVAARPTLSAKPEAPRPRPPKFKRWTGWHPWFAAGSVSKMASTPVSDESTTYNRKHSHRTPGINQNGTIPGFLDQWMATPRKSVPCKTTPDFVDQEALAETLAGL